MSACIIPVAPNFQDPPSVPDAPPYLSNFQANSQATNVGEIVTIPGAGQVTFSANVTDNDVGHPLRYLWTLDYPPFKNGVTKLLNQGDVTPPLDGQPIKMQLTQIVDCNFIGRPSEGAHQLELIVADRDFSKAPDLTADNVLDSIDDPTGFVVRASWTIVASCSAIASSTSGAP
jgi:hypothetical protein